MSPSPLPTIERGSGASLVFLHGFALSPTTYERAVGRLADHVRVLAPMWLYVEGPWAYDRALLSLARTVETQASGEAVVVGHSAGGGLALGLAATRPDLVSRLVLIDTLGASTPDDMARNARPRRALTRLAHAPAVRDFFGSVLTRPGDVRRAAMWAYRHDPSREIALVRAASFPVDVLWAERDLLLPRPDGERFAEQLGARFTVVEDRKDRLDHDWPLRHPDRLHETLADLGVLPPAPS